MWTDKKHSNAPAECTNIMKLKTLMELINEEGVAELTTIEEKT